MPFEIERSQQTVPSIDADAERVPLAPSRALSELAAHAPVIPSELVLGLVDFPFSNDDSPAYYDQIQARTALPEYREATNRVAVIVGEGSLMAALPMIEEETVILVDSSQDMCTYMQRYIEALKEADNFDEWGELMGMKNGEMIAEGAMDAVRRAGAQARHWLDAGYEHPIESQEAYDQARTAAHEKAIIPWRADLSDEAEMRYLGDALGAHDAHVTMLNLTNAFGSSEVAVDGAAEIAETLSALPLTPNAPILATSFLARPMPMPRALSVGPFFGLENLKEHGGASLEHLTRQSEDAIAMRIIGSGLLGSLLGALGPGRGAPIPRRGFDVGILSLGPDGAQMVPLEALPPELRAILSNDLDL